MNAPTCVCGRPMICARRFEAERTVDVWWCLDGCGREDPPFRQGAPLTGAVVCHQCFYLFPVNRAAIGQRRFCSRACQREWHDAHIGRNKPKAGEVTACTWCRRPFTPVQIQNRQRYCSRSHATSAQNQSRKAS